MLVSHGIISTRVKALTFIGCDLLCNGCICEQKRIRNERNHFFVMAVFVRKTNGCGHEWKQ